MCYGSCLFVGRDGVWSGVVYGVIRRCVIYILEVGVSDLVGMLQTRYF